MPENAEGKVTKHTLSGQTIAKLLGGKGIRYRLGEVFPDRVEIYAQSNRSGCRCPDCREKSTANHSSYQRNLQSLPIDGKRVTIHLIVRKYRCRNPGCGRRIFAEQLPGMTEERSRRTVKARTFLESLLLEVSSVKGAYLTRLNLWLEFSMPSVVMTNNVFSGKCSASAYLLIYLWTFRT